MQAQNNKRICHAEHVSASQDNRFRNMFGVTHSKAAFTLAEVLITLGIIGIVAAITLPGLLTKCQKLVIKNQFKEQYSRMQQAFKIVENNMDSTPECYYWLNTPYQSASCVEYTEQGACKKYEMPDGSPLPSDYNGHFSQCAAVKDEMKGILKVTQICKDKAYKNGCIPNYKGIDTIIADINPDKDENDINKQTADCAGWRQSSIHNDREAWVLLDGTIILFYSGFQLFAIDVNGKKGPNKWGHDLFSFIARSNGDQIQLKDGACSQTEKGGVSTATMIKNLFNK